MRTQVSIFAALSGIDLMAPSWCCKCIARTRGVRRANLSQSAIQQRGPQAMLRLATFFLVASSFAGTAIAQDVVKPVKLLTLQAQDAGNVRQFFGKVVARQTVDLAFQVGGQILEFPAIEGEIIPKGNLVAQLDLESFELSLEQARLQREQADRVVARYQRLQGSAVSEVALEDAITDAALAKVQLRNAEKALEDATLHAPYDALVAQRLIENFSTIGAGTAIIRLHDMSELRIEIDVPEVLFQQAGTNPDVTVTAQFPASDQIFPVTLREFNAETSNVGQTFQLTFGLAPPEGLRVLPGSSVTITATLHDGRSGLAVPATALVPDGSGGLFALVFRPDDGDTGALSRVPVEVEPTSSGLMRVLSGLEQGDEIVAMGAEALQDGQRVRRFVAFGQ
jgi:RND family efflux transporter MFP subunit